MRTQLTDFVKSNIDDILDITRNTNNRNFLEWVEDRKQQQVVEKITSYRIDYAESPENIVIQREDNERMLMACVEIKSHLGHSRFTLLALRFGLRLSTVEISKQFGWSRQWTSVQIHKAFRETLPIVKRMLDNGMIDKDMLTPIPSYYLAHTPVEKVCYPMDSAKDTFVSSYTYNGKLLYKTKCMIPEYLEEAFHDKNTICNLCQGKFGKSNCKRKDYYNSVRNIVE